MAERRMLTRKVTDDDRFMNLSSSAQALYLHLSMNADDDGFCNQVSVQMFRAHASIQDLEALLSARFIYHFESGVIVIKHWRMANALRKDRYNETTFKRELSMLCLDENGAYTMQDDCQSECSRLPDGCQMVANCLPQDSIGKDSTDKKSSGASRTRSTFVPPTIDEIDEYVHEQGYEHVNAEKFFSHYEANGWIRGKAKVKMKDWKAAVRYWEASAKETENGSGRPASHVVVSEMPKEVWPQDD